MIEAILLDLDGVLVHTDEFHYLAWQALARRLGIPFTRAQGDRCRGVSRMESLDIVLEGADRTFTAEEKAALAEEKNRTYQGYLAGMTPADLSPETRDTLAELRRRGYRLALASGSKNAPLILGRTGLRPLLDAAADGSCITRSKPDPEIFLAAAGMLGPAPARCAAVDDAAAGVAAGKAAGMFTVAFGPAAKSLPGDAWVQDIGSLLTIFPGPGEEADA